MHAQRQIGHRQIARRHGHVAAESRALQHALCAGLLGQCLNVMTGRALATCPGQSDPALHHRRQRRRIDLRNAVQMKFEPWPVAAHQGSQRKVEMHVGDFAAFAQFLELRDRGQQQLA